MAAKLTRLTHKIAIQVHIMSESCTTFSLQAASLGTFGYTLVIDFGLILVTWCNLKGTVVHTALTLKHLQHVSL